MEYLENKLSYEDYVSLRNSVGWLNFEPEQVAGSLRNSLYDITVEESGQTIAMGRMVGDGVYFLIVDVVVRPEYQRQGIGSRIIDKLLVYVEEHTPVGGRSSVQLLSEKGKEAFYIQKGFKLLPHEFCGPGMRKIIRK